MTILMLCLLGAGLVLTELWGQWQACHARLRAYPFQFSRYNMYTNLPGTHRQLLAAAAFNLPDNQDRWANFEVTPEGFLDAIRPAKVLFAGGSAAFGTGSTAAERTISGRLRADGIDVINLAVPGYVIAQEVIAIIEHIDRINPETVILYDSANDLGFTMPLDYNNLKFKPASVGFYKEELYGAAVDQFFVRGEHALMPTGMNFPGWVRHLAGSCLYRSFVLSRTLLPLWKRLSNMYRPARASLGCSEAPTLASYPQELLQERMGQGIHNYLHWLSVLKYLCAERGIQVIVVTQPYYSWGRSEEQFLEHRFRRNKPYDNMMHEGIALLTERLSALAGIAYIPLHEEFATEDLGFFCDAVHMTDEGYERVAKYLRARLTKEASSCAG